MPQPVKHWLHTADAKLHAMAVLEFMIKKVALKQVHSTRYRVFHQVAHYLNLEP
jgi:hypothetical protein